MPNRIIKESIHESEKVNQMTDFQFRLWVNLITYVDDYGRGDARPAIIKGKCFPLRDRLTIKDIEAALNKLADIGCVGLYTVGGKPYLYFPNWESHQTIRNKKSKYPAPAQSESTCKQMIANASKCPRNPIQSEYNPNPNPESNPKREGADKPPRSPRFVPPTVEEVRAYCAQRKNAVDPEMFVDFYTAKGWKIGKDVMQDWKSAVRTWERRDGRGSAENTPADSGGGRKKQEWGIQSRNLDTDDTD